MRTVPDEEVPEEPAAPTGQQNYGPIIEHIFAKYYQPDTDVIPFVRNDIVVAAEELGLRRPGNLGDVLYAFRYRRKLPQSVLAAAPPGKQWVIRGIKRAHYAFCAVPGMVWIEPNQGLITTKVPDATPEIIRHNALGDEQALLALLRYNRLIDIFLGLTTYSLQNHLRTAVRGVQVEVDEMYLAVDKHGVQYVLPVQAKGGSDLLGRIQVEQDIAVCQRKFPKKVMRPIAAQFMADGIALFEVTIHDDRLVVVREAHYQLVPYDSVTDEDREFYKRTADVPPPPTL